MFKLKLKFSNENKKKILLETTLVLFAIFSIAIFLFVKYKKILTHENNQQKIVQQSKSDETFNPDDALKNLPNLRDKYSFPTFDYKKSDYKPSIPNYQISIDEIKNLHNFEKKGEYSPDLKTITFSDEEKKSLEQSNFFVAINNDDYYDKDPKENSTRIDDWTDLYDKIGGWHAEEMRVPENSVFVTSDFMLHVYHRLLDKEFEYVEQKEFYPRLKKISDTMLKASIDSYNNSQLDSKKESFERLVAYFAVPDAILNTSYNFYKNEEVGDDGSIDSIESTMETLDRMKNKLPAQSYEIAKQELELVMSADKRSDSPLFSKYQNELNLSFQEDYTQYGPRSHYSKNPILRSYFRSMMWFGRQNFLVKSPELTRDAMNIVLLMNQSKLMKDWEDIYVPTSFFVGESDDLGLYEYQKVLSENKDVAPGDGLVSTLQQQIGSLKSPQIMSSLISGDGVVDSTKAELQEETKGFRFMGQRFTPDAFVFSSLTQGDERKDPKTGESLPSMPTALMVMSSLGNATADKQLENWISSDAPESGKVIADRLGKLKQYFNTLDQNWWSQNIYWGWTYTLKSLSQESLSKEGYPNFMKNDEWDRKNLQAALGSWTELKHDTLLYSKQSYAEMGGGGPEGKIPPVPKGYVEPNIEFLDRLIPLAKMTKEGLEQRGLLDQEFLGRNASLLDSLEFFRKIAIAEVNNEKISESDFERLRLEAGNLSSVLLPLPNEQRTEDLARSALIADVHTDGVSNQILYEADGIPNYIYVAIKDSNGTRLTKGLVYSYYEFKNPLEKRLSDTEWKDWVYARDEKQMPKMPDWNNSLVK